MTSSGTRIALGAVAPRPVLVEVSPGDGMIERVITNLIDNAIRHTPADGEVRLETAPTAKGVEVRVADTGVGIAPELRQAIFEPFRQGDGSSTRAYGSARA